MNSMSQIMTLMKWKKELMNVTMVPMHKMLKVGQTRTSMMYLMEILMHIGILTNQEKLWELKVENKLLLISQKLGKI